MTDLAPKALDVPTFPTDSLYKFMALAGLAGVFLVPKFYLSQWSDAERQAIETYTAMRSLEAETEYLDKDLQSLEQGVARERHATRKIDIDVKALDREVTDASRRRALSRSQTDELAQKKAALAYRIKQLGHAHREMEKVVARVRKQNLRNTKVRYEIEGKNQLLASLTYSLKTFKVTFWVLVLASWCSAVFGFRLWYTHIQKYQDRLVKKQGGAP